MGRTDITIDKAKALSFARIIYSDVNAYIQLHKEEFHKFLLQQEGEENNED